MGWSQRSGRKQRRSCRRLRCEALEHRRAMACLSIGVTLDTAAVVDNGVCPVADQSTPIQVGKVGQEFNLDIRVQDVRGAGQLAAGVIGLPLHVSWDPSTIAPLNAPTPGPIAVGNPLLTDSFPLQRVLQGFDADAGPYQPPVPPPANPTPNEFLPFANLQGLRGAALPNLPNQGVAVGSTTEETFSTLGFEALKTTVSPADSLFTIRVAGSMSFADASLLEQVTAGSNTTRVDAITVQARLQIDPVVISGIKFEDLDGDGMRDGNEPGLGDWTIRLIRDDNLNNMLDASDTQVATTTTAADGTYQLSVTDAGTYFVREVQQTGWEQTSPDPAPIRTSGMDVANVDFGNREVPAPPQANSLSGFVFADTNLNGQFDANEDGLPNVTVEIRRTGVTGAALQNVLTGPDGWYHFENLEPASYDVIEIQPAGFANASISRGLVFPPGSSQPSDGLRGMTDGLNAFRGVNLSGGGNAVDFNFGDNLIPTKRRFVASVDPFADTCSHLGLNCVTVRGTSGNDQIEFLPDTDSVRVTVNNQPAQEFSRDRVDIVKIDAREGDDTVRLTGDAADDVAHLQSASCTIQVGSYRPGDYAVLAVGGERSMVSGGLGSDLAVLRDSAVDDVLTAMNDPFIGPVTELESVLSMNRFIRAVAFERTRAVSLPANGTDTALLNGAAIELVGDWIT